MPLFTEVDLGRFVQDDVTAETATVVERVVWGWLKPSLGVDERPVPASEQLWSWALELGAIALENPRGLASYQLGAERWQYSAERKREILDDAASAVSGATGTGEGVPRGSFPAAPSWPDPIQRSSW